MRRREPGPALLAATSEGAPGEEVAHITGAASTRRPPSAYFAGYAACTWSFVFAALSFYWAAGGTAGSNTLADSIKEGALARDPAIVALAWGAGALKIVGGLLALTLIQAWGRLIWRWMLLMAAWGTAALLMLHGGLNLAVRAIMAVGIIPTPASMHSAAAYWYLVLWDPWFVIGGILFGAAAWSFSHLPRRDLAYT
ncbi:MAG: DUF3995 domain-containing protein [Chloroflexota bacterium]|nr:DUF3995 domain-containing protein [Chloroflexota bacterium]